MPTGRMDIDERLIVTSFNGLAAVVRNAPGGSSVDMSLSLSEATVGL